MCECCGADCKLTEQSNSTYGIPTNLHVDRKEIEPDLRSAIILAYQGLYND